MHMRVEADGRGRVYLAKSIRDKHAQRFHVVDLPNRVVLIPLADDPIDAARTAVGDTFAGKSSREIKDETVLKAKQEIEAEERDRKHRET